MANYHEHRYAGRLCGALAAWLYAQDQGPLGQVLETIGGGIAGDLGGALPDWFDPPTHSYHRSLAHGVAPAVVAGRALIDQLPISQRSLREAAVQCEERWRSGASESERAEGLLGMLACRIVAGALPGLIAGYASHLVLDFRTPRCLPLIG